MCQYIITIFLIVILMGSAAADDINIPADYASIQAGINVATDGDIVLVADGTYFENINFKGKAITVASHYFIDGDTSHIANTIIDGSRASNPDSGSVIYFVTGEDTTSVLNGFTITNGTGTMHSYSIFGYEITGRGGGGIFCFNSGGRILFNRIVNNNVSELGLYFNLGGGISILSLENRTAYIIIEGNQITNNTVNSTDENNSGGGISMFCNGRVVNNTISYNSCVTNGTASGGGIDCSSDTLGKHQVIIENNQITHNSITSKSIGEGGGLGIYRVNALVQNNNISYNEVSADEEAHGAGMQVWRVDDKTQINANTFTHNIVTKGRGFGGGLSLWDCHAFVSNNIISFNSANSVGNGMGGGIFFWQGSKSKIINNTITNNDAALGGGINVQSSSPIFINTIVWANQAPSDPEIHAGYLNVTFSDIQSGWSGVGNIDADPLFADTTFALSENSRCIDAGDPNSPIDPDGTRADIGAKFFFHLTSPYIWKTTEKIDDSAGNNNGKPDTDETVNIIISLINTSLDATGVSAQLVSDDPTIQILQNDASFGDMTRNQIANNENNPFTIYVQPETVPHTATFYFHVSTDGNYTNIDSMKVIVGTPEILIVDDDGGAVYENIFIEALNAKDIYPEHWDILAQGIPAKDRLLQFKAVIWFTGDERENTFTIEEQSVISEYLDEDGRLLITGQNIGYDLVGNGTESDSAFFHNYLHAQYIADSSHAEMSMGINGDPITDKMFVYFKSTGGAGNQTSTDIIEPIQPAVRILKYLPIMKSAAVRFEDETVGSRLVYLAFGIEGISGPNIDTAGLLLEKSLNWLTSITHVNNEIKNSVIPDFYKLGQNYPNPFNPKTTISYQLPVNSQVELTIYGITGQKITTLVSEQQQPGNYRYEWDASSKASGVYFYRLSADDPKGTGESFVETKKLILLK
jgi:hypothetical protein